MFENTADNPLIALRMIASDLIFWAIVLGLIIWCVKKLGKGKSVTSGLGHIVLLLILIIASAVCFIIFVDPAAQLLGIKLDSSSFVILPISVLYAIFMIPFFTNILNSSLLGFFVKLIIGIVLMFISCALLISGNGFWIVPPVLMLFIPYIEKKLLNRNQNLQG